MRFNMAETCPNLHNCGFFKNFGGNADVIKEGWKNMYCNNLQKSDACKRKQYKKLNGTPPPDNMAPTGKLIN